jgi:hypothetical protein
MVDTEPSSAGEDGRHATRRDDHDRRDNRGASLYALEPDLYLDVAWGASRGCERDVCASGSRFCRDYVCLESSHLNAAKRALMDIVIARLWD